MDWTIILLAWIMLFAVFGGNALGDPQLTLFAISYSCLHSVCIMGNCRQSICRYDVMDETT